MMRVIVESPAVLDAVQRALANRLVGSATRGERMRAAARKRGVGAELAGALGASPHDIESPAPLVVRCRRCGKAWRYGERGYEREACPGARLDLGAGVRVEGEPVRGEALCVFVYVLPRCDIDAPTKAVQDAAETLLFAGGNDRAIRGKAEFLARPWARLPRQLVLEAYALATERGAWIASVSRWAAWAASARPEVAADGQPTTLTTERDTAQSNGREG